MVIENINIKNFGKLSDFKLEFCDGINIIEGKNESGKSTICSFIKFMFYGLSPEPDERAKEISWNSGNCAGSMKVREDSSVYRIEREAFSVRSSEGKVSYRERACVYDDETGKQVFKGGYPGEFFFGIPRAVFESTAFIGQLEGTRAGGKPLAEAAENILFSADETVNTKKAIKKLDEARVRLYHKNRRGGKIYDYVNERTRLAESLDEAQRTSAQIINLEGSARALTETRTSARKNLLAAEEELAVYERYVIKKNCLKLLDEKKKSENAAQRLHELLTHDRYGVNGMTDEQFISLAENEKYELISLENDLKNSSDSLDEITRKIALMNAKLDRFQNLGSSQTRDELVEKSRRARSAVSLFRKLCIAFFALAAVLFAASFFMPLTAAAGGASAVFAVIMLLLSIKNGRDEKEIYRRFKCGTREDFQELLDAAQNDDVALSLMEDSKMEALRKKELVQERLEAKKARICGILSAANFATTEDICADIDKAVNTARRSLDELHRVAREKNDAQAKIKELSAVLSSYTDDERERALSENFDEERIRKLDVAAKKRERDFLSLSVNTQTEKLHDIECELASLSAVRARPAEIAQSINALDGKIEMLTEKFDAYMLAIESLEAASDKLRDAVSPKIAKTASRIMSSVSGGKYRTVFVDSDFSVSYSDEGITRDISSLSAGTSDIAYISLRLALIDTLCKQLLPPLVFDESFAKIDNERLSLVFSLIDSYLSKNAQAIVFTCHEREKKSAEDIVKANLLSI